MWGCWLTSPAPFISTSTDRTREWPPLTYPSPASPSLISMVPTDRWEWMLDSMQSSYVGTDSASQPISQLIKQTDFNSSTSLISQACCSLCLTFSPFCPLLWPLFPFSVLYLRPCGVPYHLTFSALTFCLASRPSFTCYCLVFVTFTSSFVCSCVRSPSLIVCLVFRYFTCSMASDIHTALCC